MATEFNPGNPRCDLLIFLAIPAERVGLEEAAGALGLAIQPVRTTATPDSPAVDLLWLGQIGDQTVLAAPPARTGGRVVMGAVGALGTAARGVRLRALTRAQSVVQLGMAFGVDRDRQQLGTVLVSTALVAYDSRRVSSGAACETCGRNTVVEYLPDGRWPARAEMVELLRRHTARGPLAYNVNLGAMLSGAAVIHSSQYRDELVRDLSAADAPVVGGEMEGVGLLSAASSPTDPVWCVVKGVSDFADERRDEELGHGRPVACRNAAHFLLSALLADAA